MIAICTFETKIGYKKFLTLIGPNKLSSPKNSDPGLNYYLKIPTISMDKNDFTAFLNSL